MSQQSMSARVLTSKYMIYSQLWITLTGNEEYRKTLVLFYKRNILFVSFYRFLQTLGHVINVVQSPVQYSSRD